MDEFDDILLDDYNPFDGEGDSGLQTGEAAAAKNSLTGLTEGPNSNRKRPAQDDQNMDVETDGLPQRKQRQKLKKLDHHVLCAPEGLTRLRNETPWLKFRGKGHEDEDLLHLMRYYRMWAYNLYPRFNFSDFSSRVMKACANKQCKMQLEQWREEYEFKNGLRYNEISKTSSENVTGDLSGMTLEDEDQDRRSRENERDQESTSQSDSSDDDVGGLTSLRLPSTDNQTSSIPTGNQDEQAATNSKYQINDDEVDNEALFFNTPTKSILSKAPSTTLSGTSSNDLSIDDFFAD